MNLSESLFFSSKLLTRYLDGLADDAFREVGLSSSYAFLLMMAEDEPGIQPKQLSERLQLTPSTITRLVEKMEYQGYVERRSEGRATHIELTSKGRNLIPKLHRCWQQLKEEYTEILGERYTDVLAEMTFKASRQLQPDE